MSQQENPKDAPMDLGPVQSKNSGGAGSGRPKTARRSPLRFQSHDDIKQALVQMIGLWLDGTIDASELKVAQSTFKTLADLLPKGGETQAISISARLRARLADDPDLLNELSKILPVDLLSEIVRD